MELETVFAGSLSLNDVLLKLGYSALNPMQQQALPLLGERRLMVSAPTASGKTLLAVLKIAKNFLETKTKALYVVPLRALASEKHSEFERSLASFEMKVAISTGDYDSNSEELAAYDVIIVTSEKLDSLLRHKAKWIDDVGLTIVDEVHLLNDDERGATLEIVLTKLMQTPAQLLCLSATVPNNKEIAAWLSAELFTSSWRPTPLEIGVCDKKKIHFEKKSEKISDEKLALHELVEKALSENQRKGQSLVFVSTRKNAETQARELTQTTKKFLTEEEQKECEALAARALRALGTPTRQCRLLADCLKNGVSFHHAGIESKQRQLIEKGFKRDRCIKAIVCTTTLAMGIDYPASWVIVRDLKRFNGAFSEFIPNLECQQMLGRAGRPRFDPRGIGILVCKPSERREVAEKYVYGPLENIYSKLSSEPVLREHVLALISEGYCRNSGELKKFFEKTFFAFQYGSAGDLFAKVERVAEELKDMDFVREKQSTFLATPVGKRTAELYIDPLTAYAFLKFIDETKKRDKNEFAFLMALNGATEARPLIEAAHDEENALWEELYSLLDDFDIQATEFDAQALDKYKTAKVLNAWINEDTEDNILNQFNIPPGVLHARMRNAEWLAYALQELAFMQNATAAFKKAKILKRRIKHGVKHELLELCRVRGIGRVRARKLYAAGIRTLDEFRAKTREEIKKILKTGVEDVGA